MMTSLKTKAGKDAGGVNDCLTRMTEDQRRWFGRIKFDALNQALAIVLRQRVQT
jgi:hypothetical protein